MHRGKQFGMALDNGKRGIHRAKKFFSEAGRLAFIPINAL
jgi:hypothetical protein